MKFLEGILQRLPIELIFRFKCISKRWLSLISHPLFVHSYITNNSHNPPWGFIFSRSDTCKIVWFSHPGFPTPGFCFDFHKTKCPNSRLNLLASHNGLLLSCSTQRNSHHFYHVWNPLTLKFITIPPLLHRNQEQQNLGFIVENHGNFWIVSLAPFQTPTNYLEFEVYDSKISTWSLSRVSCPRHIHSSGTSRAVIYNGNTHWLFGNDCIVFNPRNGCNQFRFICTPGEHVNLTRKLLGVSGNNMRYCETHDLSSPGLRIWELMNYESREWSLVHEGNLEIWKLSMDLDEDEYSLSGYDLIPLAFHPLDSNILFFECFGKLVSCELITGNLQFVANMDLISVHELIPFILPSWPTPVGDSGCLSFA